jgi:TctA family transporter
MVFALSATAAMSKKNMAKGFISLFFGLMVSTDGLDAQSVYPGLPSVFWNCKEGLISLL